MAGSLWTPRGAVLIERSVIALSEAEMARMAAFHEVAAKYGFTVQCQKCGHSLVGKNQEGMVGGVYVVACRCREYKCDVKLNRALEANAAESRRRR